MEEGTHEVTAGLSRRSFLVGAALAGAGVIGTSIVGCSRDNEDTKKTGFTPTEFFDAEVVVCGTGTAGMSAAIRAAQLGAKVIVVEVLTENGVGGNSKYVEATWKAGDAAAIEKAVAAFVEYHKGAVNFRVVRKFCNDSLRVQTWAVSEVGVQMNPAVPGKYLGGGQQAMATMYEFAKGLGVTFIFNARAEELVVNNDGSVAGVICSRLNGNRLKVTTPVVVIATGGFAANKEMFEEYTHYNYDNLIAYGSMGSQRGDGIKMGLSVDAALHHPEAINFCSPVLPGHFNKSALVICGCNQADQIWVNQDGERFCDESIINDWTLSGNAGALQPKIFTVFDTAFVKHIQTEGPVTKRSNYFVANVPVPGFLEEIEKGLTRDHPRIVRSDTLKGLADALEIDPDTFVETVNTWNQYCDKGYDADFLHPKKYMRKVSVGPFYGCKTMLAYYASVNGLRVDEHARVLTREGKRVLGLYAGGGDAGAIFGGCYDVSIAPGSTQCWARSTGVWAAEHAVNTYLPGL